jgi:hypothetical protein
MKVSTEIDNNFGYEKTTQLVDNNPLTAASICLSSILIDQNLFIWPSMRTRLEQAHCLETINNMWFLGKRETVNAWQKANLDGFRDKEE